MSGLSMSKPLHLMSGQQGLSAVFSHTTAWILVEVPTKRVVYLLLVLTLTRFWFTSWSPCCLYWDSQEVCRSVEWGSGDVPLCLLLSKTYGTVLQSPVFWSGKPSSQCTVLWGSIQLHSVGAGTFIFLVLLRHKITVWQFLAACKDSEETLRRNG